MTDSAELEKFQRIAADWWDQDGPLKPLHRINAARMGYIVARLRTYFAPMINAAPPAQALRGLRILDIGCGGGLVAEPLARLGAQTYGIDAVHTNIEVARAHARETGLDITYVCGDIADAPKLFEKLRFDAVMALEIIEHVDAPEEFVAQVMRCLRPGGTAFFSTINRTLKALLLAKIGAEYILRWLPAGTHDPRKFIKPDEIASWLAAFPGASVLDKKGLCFAPLQRKWQLCDDLQVNYFLQAGLR